MEDPDVQPARQEFWGLVAGGMQPVFLAGLRFRPPLLGQPNPPPHNITTTTTAAATTTTTEPTTNPMGVWQAAVDLSHLG
jgi:hypothetical protein